MAVTSIQPRPCTDPDCGGQHALTATQAERNRQSRGAFMTDLLPSICCLQSGKVCHTSV